MSTLLFEILLFFIQTIWSASRFFVSFTTKEELFTFYLNISLPGWQSTGPSLASKRVKSWSRWPTWWGMRGGCRSLANSLTLKTGAKLRRLHSKCASALIEATKDRRFLDLDFLTLFEGIHCKKFLIKTFQNPSVFPRTSLAIESVEWSKRRLRAGRRARKGCFVICHLLLGLLLVVSLASGLLELSWLIACHTALVKTVVGVRG